MPIMSRRFLQRGGGRRACRSSTRAGSSPSRCRTGPAGRCPFARRHPDLRRRQQPDAGDASPTAPSIFFPALDRLGEPRPPVGARTRPRAGGARRIALSGRAPGAQRHTVTLAGAAPRVTRFDLAVVLDTTGSMGDEIDFLKSELRAILADIGRGHPELDIRLALVAYRDVGDLYRHPDLPVHRHRSTRCRRTSPRSAPTAAATMPEAMDQALARAIGAGLAARRGPLAAARRRCAAARRECRQDLGRRPRRRGRGGSRSCRSPPRASATLAEYVMRAMAAATQSRYLFLTDDSGIGNPHAAAGGRLLPRHPARPAGPARARQPDLRPRGSSRREGEVIRTVGDLRQGPLRASARISRPETDALLALTWPAPS